ncbi:MAG TPA: PilZ domain-containing protein [Solirubrobacteraceae bacterium]|nr:PilZ domain-containing protein [Solirubrobacteraceae bacterium]
MTESAPPARGGNVVPHPVGAQGKLTTPHGEEVPVRTFEQGEDVVLVVLADIDDSLLDEQLEPSLLEYTSVRGVIRMRGEATFEQRSLVRFHVQGDAEVIQRREFVRVHSPQPVMLGPPAEDAGLPARTVDLSGGGMLLTGADGLSPGDRVRFRMRLGENTATIGGVARVVRIREDGKRALMFEQIDEGDRQRLIRFVFQILRTARAKTRGDLV